MLTRGRAIGAVAVLVFAGFCLGGWLFLRPYFDGKGAATGWTEFTVDGPALTVHYEGDTCEDKRSVEVRESSDEVVVTIFVEADPLAIPFLVGCGSDGERFQVELESPIGDRAVLDGACLEQDRPRDDCLRTPIDQR